jgi:polyhydroxyalkanoate synthesis regulator phasin
MTELVSRAIFAGLGFMSLTTEAIQETVADLVKQSKLSEEEGRKVVKAFAQRSGRMEQKLERRVDAAVHKVLKNLDLRTLESRLKRAKKLRPKKKSKRPGKSTAAGGKRHKR